MAKNRYDESVFINCPFDSSYKQMFDAIVFAVFDCGYTARSALEISDSGQIRLNKILDIIEQSKFGIHDISFAHLDPKTRLARFNMPLELGLFLGAKQFGQTVQREKICLIVDKSPYRFRKFISDISGQDPSAHKNSPSKVITIIRDWLNDHSKNGILPGGKVIIGRYRQFKRHLPELCRNAKLDENDLTFTDRCAIISEWLNYY